MNAVRILAFVAALGCTCPVQARAATLRVPADYATIAAAMTAAAPGDSIVIACGDYYEHDIALKSGIVLSSETGIADCVTIDGSGLGNVFLGENLPETVLLRGLTIQGGLADEGISTIGPGRRGGAIYIRVCFLDAASCVIRENDATYRGGGIAAVTSNVLLTNCDFLSNHANEGGGGLHAENSAVRMFGCDLIGNSTGPVTAGGGAVQSTSGLTVEMTDCRIHNNTSARGGGGVYLTTGGVIRNSEFFQNTASTSGGGLFAPGTPIRVTVLNSLFHDNTAANGGAIACRTLTMTSTTIVNNQGGGIHYTAPAGGPQIFMGNIISFNNGPAVACDYPVTFNISCCNIFGNVEGGDWDRCVGDQHSNNPSNISRDPLFCDFEGGDFTLRSDSPCAPANSAGCGLIGAYPVSCGAVSVDQELDLRAWGSIKGLYR